MFKVKARGGWVLNISIKGLVAVLGKSQEALVVAALASAEVMAMAGVLSPGVIRVIKVIRGVELAQYDRIIVR